MKFSDVQRPFGAAVAALTCAGILAACGVPADSKPRAIPANQVPFELLTPSTSEPPTTLPVVTAAATIYLLNPDRLVPVTRIVAAPVSLGTLLARLVQGPNDAETAAGLRSSIDPQTRVLNTQLNNGTALINVDSSFSTIGVQAQIRALAQLVYTATALPEVNDVRVTLESKTSEVPRGDGTLTHDPLKRSDYAAVAPAS